MPFINRPHFTLSPIHRFFAHYIDPPIPKTVTDPTIHLVTFPKKFDEDGRAVFNQPPKHREKEKAWMDDYRPDLVVLCTGYKQDWSFLGEEYPTAEDLDIRGVCSSKDPTVGFVGFLRPVGSLF